MGKRGERVTMATNSSTAAKPTKRIYRFTAPADVQAPILVVDYQEKADDVWIYPSPACASLRISSLKRRRASWAVEFSTCVSHPPLD